MKIQSEFYSNENGINYFEQYFNTQTPKPINASDYFMLKESIENALYLLMQDKKIELTIIIKEQ
jgi:hypothetical protein